MTNNFNEHASITDLVDRDAIDPDGDKIGTVFDVYVDNDTGQPEWLAITTGLFGTKVTFAPLAGASLVGDGVRLAYPKDHVKDAPRAEADGQLSPEEENELYAHYGYPSAQPSAPTGRDEDYGRTGASEDAAMTRSEEELEVVKTSRQTGRARLRKWVETEDVQMTVPIRREKAKLVTEPITSDEAATAGGDVTEAEEEVVLSEEVVDVDKRVVPKERVRLETDVETDEVVVDEQVRKERIDLDDDTR
jgi:uncharacterized protein (TIGR02271 family)